MGKLWRVALTNAEIADRLESLAALLDLKGSSPYASRAYRRAAETIRETPAPIPELVRTGRVRELRGIGPGIEARLRELVETGRLVELDELKGEVSPELVGLGRLLGFGPQRAVEIGQRVGGADGRRISRGCSGGTVAPGTRDRAEDRGEAPRRPRAR